MPHPARTITRLLALPIFPLALPVGAQAPELPRIHAAARGHYTSILMWHDVVPKKKEVWFDTTVAEIEEQFQHIKKRGLTPVTLERLANHLEKGSAIPRGAVVLTFDDNTLGLYRHLFPILKRYRWPAVFFVHTGYVGVKTGKDHCTWEQLREMEGSGLVKAYPHTVTHPLDMRELKDPALQKELVQGRQSMEKRLGGPRRFFSYSNGFYDERVARAVSKAGYRLAITEDWGAAQRSPNLMMVRRYSMHKRARQAVEDTARAMKKTLPR
jgi:peptidoglycan/xylan/chitin deacetylase (PgdA/CDA1 family)